MHGGALPPSASSTAADVTPVQPTAQCTPATAVTSNPFATGALGGVWEARGCPPPLPVRAQRGGSRAAAAAAAETPSIHRAAAPPAAAGVPLQGANPPCVTDGGHPGSARSDASHATILGGLQQEHLQQGHARLSAGAGAEGGAWRAGRRTCVHASVRSGTREGR